MTSMSSVLSGESRWCVINADCADVLSTPGFRVGATITDPPYGVNLGSTSGSGGKHGLKLDSYDGFDDSYETFVSDIVPRINAAIDISTRAAVFTGPHIHEQRKPSAIGGVYCPASNGRHCWGFKNFLPVLLYDKAPNLNLGAKYPTAIQSTESANREETDHPVPKPLGWMLWLVNLASVLDEVVFDPFCGEGTTGVAAIRLGRRFIGVERSKKYADTARERLTAEACMSSLKDVRNGQSSLNLPQPETVVQYFSPYPIRP